MKRKIMIGMLAGVAVLATGGYGLYRAGMQEGMKAAPASAQVKPDAGAGNAQRIDPQTGRKVLYWHDPMVPGPKFDQPGKSPFMDMQLVPVYADEAGDEGKVSISPRVQQNLGIRTAEATLGSLDAPVQAVGSIAYNEREVALVQARSNGYVERLYARAPLDRVRKGQPLAELYVPDWVAAQEEYLSVKRMGSLAAAEGLLDAARQRMRLAGMSDAQIRLVESSGKIHPRMTLVSPLQGVVGELGAREGMTVMNGATLFRINGLGTVWVNAEIPESMAAQVRPGASAEATSPAFPGMTFKGRVNAILPEVDPATRTMKARIELANPLGQLAPGMFATVTLKPAAGKDMLLVPSEAVIATGRRTLVMVAQGEGKFAPVEVETGVEAQGRTEIRKGLEAGQKVVTSGQFLIDSEASLKGVTASMGEPPKPGAATHHGQGRVESIGKDEIVLSHGPIPSLQWGEMTMGFKPPPGGVPNTIAVGGQVRFELRPTQDGMFEIVSIAPVAGEAAKAAPAARTASDGKPADTARPGAAK